MGKRIVLGLAIILVAFVALWVVNYLALFDFPPQSTQRLPTFSSNQETEGPSQPSDSEPVPYEVEVVAENLTVPWSIVFTGEERILVSERTGAIREVKNGSVTSQPLHTFSDTARGGEIGLMGITLDPQYPSNKLLYACVGYRNDTGFADRVVQLRDNGDSLEELNVIIDNIPAASNHAGCELAFGPDGMLYISTGDATERTIAQDLNSLGGKILRIAADGSVPADNPFPNSAIYSYGHRNPQGFDWSADGILYEAEHGPSGNDGPGGGDEINLIKPGANYGWPLVSHNNTHEGTEAPLITYTPAQAPSSLIIYKGDVFPQFRDSALVAALRGQGILWVRFSPSDPETVISSEKVPEVSVGRVREVTVGPDEYIYFTSSNTDGRGRPDSTDDKIYRLVPTQR